MLPATTYSAPTYYLGSYDREGRLFVFTGLPQFRSGLEAGDYRRAHPMAGTVYILEHRELFRFGVNYGCTGYEVVGRV